MGAEDILFLNLQVQGVSPSRLFFSPAGELDRDQLLREALPLTKLVGAIGLVALVPLLLRIILIELLGSVSVLGVLLTLAMQLVIAVGAGIVLIYSIVRANHHLEETQE